MKLYRFQVEENGIFEAVEIDCPRDDRRRANKPDGSWLPKVGERYPGAISFWKPEGKAKYEDSGLLNWHKSVVKNQVTVIEADLSELEVLYEDEYQVIGRFKKP